MNIKKSLKFNLYFTLMIIILGTALFLCFLPSKIKLKKQIEIKRKINIKANQMKKLINKKDFNSALNIGINIYKKYPDHADAVCIILGDLYNLINEVKNAEWFYREAVRLDNDNPYYYVKLSRFYRTRSFFNSSRIVLNSCKNIAERNHI